MIFLQKPHKKPRTKHGVLGNAHGVNQDRKTRALALYYTGSNIMAEAKINYTLYPAIYPFHCPHLTPSKIIDFIFTPYTILHFYRINTSSSAL